MVSSLVVPVIDVQNENFKELWPAMVLAIKTASFVALDTELSGLGNRKSLLAECIEERYKAICHAARTRSILSLGIACYKKLDDKAADSYLVQVFNLTLLISEDYIIEPQSVQFLVQHGFDFNKQYAHGIPYLKGNNREGLDGRGVHIRALFTELLRARKPLVLHNGLIDIAFLYQGFYAHLPERLVTFTADLSEMFPAGIYDTKYVCEFELRLTASYLEYAYKKCKLDNSRSGPHVYVEFCEYAGHMSTYVDFRECPDVSSAEGQTDVCQRFSAFGWCPNGTQCPLSHDTDLIVLQDEKGTGDKKKKKKRNKAKKRARGDVDSSVNDGAPEQKVPHVETNPPKTPEKKPEAEPKKETLMDVAEVKVKNEGNGGCEEKKDVKVPVKAVAVKVANEAEKNNESKVEDGGGETLGELTPKKKNNVDTGTHRAGFDAFMTGYIFACSHSLKKDGAVEVKKQETEEEQKEEKKEEEPSWLPACLNKIYLSGKAAPLNVVKSTFSKSSKAHVAKMEMVWGKKV